MRWINNNLGKSSIGYEVTSVDRLKDQDLCMNRILAPQLSCSNNDLKSVPLISLINLNKLSFALG